MFDIIRCIFCIKTYFSQQKLFTNKHSCSLLVINSGFFSYQAVLVSFFVYCEKGSVGQSVQNTASAICGLHSGCLSSLEDSSKQSTGNIQS